MTEISVSSDPTSPAGLSTIRCGDHLLQFGRRTLIMGIVNVTPDSFSGDGLGHDVDAAVTQAESMVEDGADIVDVGGESTRPNAVSVSEDEEIARVVPVIKLLTRRISVPISVDTRKSTVAEQAIAAGATMVNDIWGLRADHDMAHVIARHQPIGVVVMHNQTGTTYMDLIDDICVSLAGSLQIALEAGVPIEQVIIDPGFGFGKTPAQNLEIVGRLNVLKSLGRPILIGSSNKSTLGRVLGDLPVEERRDASLGMVALAIARGADLVRVHDVKGSARVRAVADQVIHGITDDVQALQRPGRTL